VQSLINVTNHIELPNILALDGPHTSK